MRKITLLAFLLVFISINSYAYETCKEKETRVEDEITHAKTHGNKHKIKGLKKALEEIKNNCNDSVEENKHNEKIEDAQNDLKKAEKDLSNAISENKSSNKIKKKELKLKEKQLDLEELTNK